MNTAPAQQALQRVFRQFLLGDALMLVSMAVGQVAVPWWIAVENGVHDLAIFAAVSATVGCVAVPIMAALGDRFDKRSLIQIGLGVYTLSAVTMALVAGRGNYDIRVILALEAIAISGLALVEPVASVIAADILPSHLVSRGLQKQKLWQSIGQVSGPVIGGGALALGSVSFALWVQVLLLALTVALMLRLPSSPAAKRRDVRHSLLTDLTAGMRVKWRIKLERNWTAISFLVGISLVPSVGMLLPLKVRALHLSGQWLGLCEAATALGILLGAGAGMSRNLVARLGRYRMRFVAATLLGPTLMLVGCSAKPIPLAGSLILVGFNNSIVVMMGYSRRILATPHAFRTRMTAVNIMLTQIAAIIGPSLAGVMLLVASIASTYLLFGSFLLLCSLGWLLTPDFRTFMSLDDDEVEGWYGTRYPKAFEL